MPLNTTMRNTLADAAAGVINRIEILDGATVLATFSVTWGSAATGVASVASTPVGTTGAATGTADGARFYHSTGSDEITGLTVGTSSAQVILDSLSITSGQPVNLISGSLTMPAATT